MQCFGPGNGKAVEPESLTVEVPNFAVPGEGKVRRYFKYAKDLVDIPFPSKPHINNLYAGFKHGVEAAPDKPCLGERTRNADGTRGKYEFDTYKQTEDQVKRIGSALRGLGLTKGDKLGIFSINRKHWTIAALAGLSQSMILVPLYDTFGLEAIQYIIEHAELTAIVIAKDKLKSVVEVAPQLPKLKYVICIDPVDAADKELVSARKLQFQLLNLAELEKQGASQVVEEVVPSPTDLAYIMYTSGTTGNPKGVMLTHRNVVASISIIELTSSEGGIILGPGDMYISYLPLAHSYETDVHFAMLFKGATIGYYQGDVKKLFDDIQDLKPTALAGVPRVWGRIYDRVMGMVESSGGAKKALFKKALESQTKKVKAGKRSAFWDALVFKKTKARMGGRLRLMATGAAPMPAHLMEFVEVVFCAPLVQGYGLTETSGAACSTPFNYKVPGPVGVPGPCCEVKLVDVPEMGYTSKDELPRGEICIRGANIFQGYYKKPEETKETLDSDGWLHSGDIGRWNKDGTLQIIDRKKNIFKLAHGEYVAAEALENVFLRGKYIGQIWVYGSGFENTLIAVVVPKVDSLVHWAAEQGKPKDLVALCALPEVKKLIMDELTALGKENKLKGFEMIKNVFLEGSINDLQQGFNVENDCLTPTFKLRRANLQKKYADHITKMYDEIHAAESAPKA
mmetsp:Transcript_18048/g.29636  ORF Transcript_18048/g.29636 Transcript_18048/m.29636 type:complete len:681 (+) Transcript_18048:94-2136(+)|eukprot:CAMPEP_0184659282 /NCGR_PEP_ID=MMETSP0308-20130426/29114_1 /TAXON_ID=38269 /ORGANISM="Gloeochaete witrockiana, Strain SAG 46.84" /LENGTH=680 /DNA_ID=CAMNT_0027098999 /DNA_START=35 /DNA_END=2077 /DNA_ORIENTATION=+